MTSLPDAYAPREVAARVRDVGVTKARMDLMTMFTLSGLAGAFIALGALFFTVTVTRPDRWLRNHQIGGRPGFQPRPGSRDRRRS